MAQILVRCKLEGLNLLGILKKSDICLFSFAMCDTSTQTDSFTQLVDRLQHYVDSQRAWTNEQDDDGILHAFMCV
jgi:hypothetical protein